MKRILFAVLCVICVIIAFVCIEGANSSDNGEFLRIHIRADSNDDADQNVKYAVKRAVVDYLTPYLADATSKEKAIEIIKQNIGGICAVADGVLRDNGFSYKCSAVICDEYFPTRS
ncbi:MAG: stage II sporulation protein R, partial [Corallococcus sp.]|nr:stage II sporulation protein R [Corallococcus sp.]